MFIPKVVTFSGLDGAGKSTLIDSFKRSLESEGHSVTILTMYDDLSFYSLLRLIRDNIRKVFGKNNDYKNEKAEDPNFDFHKDSKFYRVIRSKALKVIVLPLDTLCIYLYLVLRISRKEVVLLDRTSYDYILDFLPENYTNFYISASLLFSFRPSLSVFVDTPAQVSFDRKGEFTVEYLSWRSVAYNDVFNMLKEVIILDNYNNSVTYNADLLVSKFRALENNI